MVRYPLLPMSTCKMTQKTCAARHVCDLFSVTFCDMTLTFSGPITFVLTCYHYQTFTSTLCDFDLLAALLTEPTIENVKTVFFTFDLTLTLYMTFIVKC